MAGRSWSVQSDGDESGLDDAITFHNIRNVLIYHDGRIKHSDLVNFFRRPLTDTQFKERSRNEFKNILQKLAIFKKENGEKYVILHKNAAGRSDTTQQILNARRPCHTRDDHDEMQNGRLMSDSDSNSSSMSTLDSGIGIGSNSVASFIAEQARSLSSKSLDSLDDELMAEFNYEEGSDDFGGYNEFSEEEKTWMTHASLCDCQQLAAMIDKNPDLPAKRDFITTALHWGAKLGKRDMVRLIADAEVDVNARTGHTALHLAAMHGHDDIIKMLINDYGADINTRDYAGRKAKDLVKDTVAPDLQRKLGRSLILDPNCHLVSGIVRRHKDVGTRGHFETDGQDYTPETRRRLRTMSFLKKKKKSIDKNDSEEEYDKRDKHKMRPKSSIYLVTPEMARKMREDDKLKSLSSTELQSSG
eukprot:gene18837-20733_t